jgi:hypothetical protein
MLVSLSDGCQVALYRLDRLEEAEDFVRAALRQQYAT